MKVEAIRPGGFPPDAIAKPKIFSQYRGVVQPKNNCPKPRTTTTTEVLTKIQDSCRSCCGV